jgi:hypothetical protein
MLAHYILVDRQPVKEPDILAWALWKGFNHAECVVAQEHVGELFISTVFLGLDHNWARRGPPLLFETMVFSGKAALGQRRCSTWSQAEEQHANVVGQYRTALKLAAVN